MDMVSIGLAFNMEDSLRIMEEAQPDIFCFHAGTTKGGRKGGKKEKKNVPHGMAFIQATFNNTIITITDPTGNVVSLIIR